MLPCCLFTTFEIRCNTSPTGGCLPWHVGGGYSRDVVQYTLNDDKSYQGGRLCFYTYDKGLFIPQRLADTVTVHKKEMHAVFRLLCGVRYVLFVVDLLNSLGGSTENIINVTPLMLDSMYESVTEMNS